MASYSLGVRTDFVAQHFLVGGDFGSENELHSHHYVVEVIVEDGELDEHGFVVDIVRLKELLHGCRDRYRDRTLNELEEMRSLNPGCEAFARVLAERIRDGLGEQAPAALTVKVWEDESAWASCRLDR